MSKGSRRLLEVSFRSLEIIQYIPHRDLHPGPPAHEVKALTVKLSPQAGIARTIYGKSQLSIVMN